MVKILITSIIEINTATYVSEFPLHYKCIFLKNLKPNATSGCWKGINQPMNTQKTISKSESLQAESLNTTKAGDRPTISAEGKLQEKQKIKRPNYMLRLL